MTNKREPFNQDNGPTCCHGNPWCNCQQQMDKLASALKYLCEKLDARLPNTIGFEDALDRAQDALNDYGVSK